MTLGTDLLINSSGNIATIILIGILYVIYQRCLSCSSSCHTGIFDCKSKAVRETIRQNKIDILMSALERHDNNTGRNLV